ncbi:helix-turn-helix transcriptional regulator [Puniceicoccus vermicola]|nr:helix-turn-helix transcriptional regulator [Puniceicoccus vermicola]
MECSPDELTAWYLESGQVEVRTSRRNFTAETGQWLFLPNGYRRQEFSADARLFSLAFRVFWLDSLRPALDLRPGLIVPQLGELEKAMNRIREQEGHPEEFEWHFRGITCDLSKVLEIKTWFLSWLAASIPVWRESLPDLDSSSEVDPRVVEARRWLEEQSEMLPVLDFEGAADRVNLSLGHLNKLFFEFYHQSLCGYHEQRRIRYARRQLLRPEVRIKEVAYEMGFVDLSKFSNWFKRLEQVSPREFRGKSFLRQRDNKS